MGKRKVKKVGIIGIGLIGGQFAEALHKAGIEIVADDTNEMSLEQVKKSGIILEHAKEKSFTEENKGYKIFSDCDCIIIATPVMAIPSIITKLEGVIRPDCVVTHTGSTQEYAAKILEKSKIQNAGGLHPFTGSHLSGWENHGKTSFTGKPMCQVHCSKTTSLTEQVMEEITELVRAKRSKNQP